MYHNFINKRFWVRYLKQSGQLEHTLTYNYDVPLGGGWREYFPIKDCYVITETISISDLPSEDAPWDEPFINVLSGMLTFTSPNPMQNPITTPGQALKFFNKILQGIGTLYLKQVPATDEAIFTLVIDKCLVDEFGVDEGDFQFQLGQTPIAE